MYRYTTPTLPVTISDLDFSDVSVFRIAIEQGNVEILKVIEADDPMVDAQHKTIYVPLTQEETAAFKDGTVEIQARIKFTNNNVLATEKATLSMRDVLDEVII